MPHNSPTTNAKMAKLRKEAGRFLQRTRLAANLTQREAAEALDKGWGQYVSAIETGRMELKREHMEAWADAVGLQHPYFAQRMLAYYQPTLSKMIFPKKDQ